MFGLDADIVAFTVVVVSVTAMVCTNNRRRELKRLKEELTQATTSLLSAENEIAGLKNELSGKSKKASD